VECTSIAGAYRSEHVELKGFILLGLHLSTDQRALRDAFSRFPTGVTVVTALESTLKPIGITISSFNSVSLHPPLVLWSLAQKSSSLSAFYLGSSHVIHVLAENQMEMAKQFSGRMENRFQGLNVSYDEHAIPVLPGCAAQFHCVTEACYPAGDHVIIVSRIKHFEDHQRRPLLFVGGQFLKLEA
jgi:flavin reductase (DIM6/NTAB) family NADH-FMN oxidoreductase RutF